MITAYHHHKFSKLRALVPRDNRRKSFDTPAPSQPHASSDRGVFQNFLTVGARRSKSTHTEGIIACKSQKKYAIPTTLSARKRQK